MSEVDQTETHAKVWVLWWRWYDGSGMGVLRAYTDEQRAKADLDLVKTDAIRDYVLEAVPLYGAISI